EVRCHLACHLAEGLGAGGLKHLEYLVHDFSLIRYRILFCYGTIFCTHGSVNAARAESGEVTWCLLITWMRSMDILERSYPGRRAELKRAILRAGLECFNAQRIEATTIEMIRSGCDTSVGAIYHHFGNKEGLIAALLFAAL